MKLPKFPWWVTALSTVGAGYGCIVIYKDTYPKYKGEEKILGRTVIVTGANTGLGYETTKDLAKRGGRVIMACRNMKKCEAARKEIFEFASNSNVVCRHLDLASNKSIREFADDINKNEVRLDTLINNAGVMSPVKPTLSEEGFEIQMAVNHLGPFLLTNLLLDKLKASAPSRIINVSALVHHRGRINFKDFNGLENYDARKSYQNSKLCSVYFTRELEKRLEGSGVSTVAVSPPVARTNIGRHMERSIISNTILGPFFWLIGRTPTEGAQCLLNVALMPPPDIARISGCFVQDMHVSEPGGMAMHDRYAQHVWAISERWTGIDNYTPEGTGTTTDDPVYESQVSHS